MDPKNERSNRLIRLPEVTHRTGAPRSSLYRWIEQGTFPPPVKIGQRAVAWPESVVDEWIATRSATRQGGEAA